MTHFNHLSLAEIDELERLRAEIKRRSGINIAWFKMRRLRDLESRRHPPIYEPRDAA